MRFLHILDVDGRQQLVFSDGVAIVLPEGLAAQEETMVYDGKPLSTWKVCLKSNPTSGRWFVMTSGREFTDATRMTFAGWINYHFGAIKFIRVDEPAPEPERKIKFKEWL